MPILLLGIISGVLFGFVAVMTRAAVHRSPDAQVGALVVVAVAAVASLPGGIAEAVFSGVRPWTLWPFALAGVLVPGTSQALFIVAIRDAGPSRVAILIGTAPLISVAIALVLLGEPFRPLLLAGTALVVAGGVVLTRERERPAQFRRIGVVAALVCAAVGAVRDNVVRWGAHDSHPPALAAVAVSFVAATLVVCGYVLATHHHNLPRRVQRALPAFAPTGVALAVAYVFLYLAYNRGRVSIIAPLNATQSLWAVMISALVVGRAVDVIGARVLVAGLLVVTGAANIGVVR